MATTKNDLITDKTFLVNLRTVYIMISSTVVGVASVLAVVYNFKAKVDAQNIILTNEIENRKNGQVELENTIRDLEKRLRDVEKK